LKLPVSKYTLIDLANSKDVETDLLDLASYMEQKVSTKKVVDIYVDRGSDADQLSLLARRNRIIFVLGWAGIGKTAFVLNRVSERLGKRPLKVSLSRGHSLDLLAMEIIRETKVQQIKSNKEITDEELLLYAIQALKKRSDNFYLFIDNAEEGFDASNQIFSYLEKLLVLFSKSNIGTHIVLATSRFPEYSPEIVNQTCLMRINPLDDQYILECIDLWLEGLKNHDEILKMPQMDEVLKLISGHPLAARMIALHLRVKPLPDILTSTSKKRFKLRLAEYILKEASKEFLSDLHLNILYLLSVVQEPVLFEDLLSVAEISKYTLDEIHKARSDLVDWFFITQEYELMSMHSFIRAYFQEELVSKQNLFESLVHDYGNYSYKKTLDINNDIIFSYKDSTEESESKRLRLSKELLRYAVPAGIFLRASGQEHLAERLPIKIKGTLRHLVFYFYQDKKKYEQAIQYAEMWLKINPKDLEIRLYQVRSYRNIGDATSLTKASTLISNLESHEYNRRFAARVFREKALIEQFKGNIEQAKAYFREGIDIYTRSPYPENRIGLAQILLREADALPLWSEKKSELADEALDLLEQAREDSDTFDRYHLATYVEALIQARREDIAFPLLEEALEKRPDDKRLNYRLAEILRKKGQYDEAEKYAIKALNAGAIKAYLTIANIKYAQGLDFFNMGDKVGAFERYAEGLKEIEKFVPEYGHDKEVADSIAAKLLRSMEKWNEAKEKIMQYELSQNPYTIYEQSKVIIYDALNAVQEGNRDEAVSKIPIIDDLLNRLPPSDELPKAIIGIFNDLNYLKDKLSNTIDDIL
jgi:tetratricopeptide (TPR) repeat protein